MKRAFVEWFQHMWASVEVTPRELANSYTATFSSAPGQVVLNDLLDKIYCSVYEGSDANEALVHNARRGVVDEILRNIDLGRNPGRFEPTIIQQESFNGA